jgi:hypothetical protein
MKVDSLTPMLRTWDLPGTIEFYTRAWSQLKDQARVYYAIETFPYGMREFAIYDNNGYLLQFGEAIADA